MCQNHEEFYIELCTALDWYCLFILSVIFIPESFWCHSLGFEMVNDLYMDLGMADEDQRRTEEEDADGILILGDSEHSIATL